MNIMKNKINKNLNFKKNSEYEIDKSININFKTKNNKINKINKVNKIDKDSNLDEDINYEFQSNQLINIQNNVFKSIDRLEKVFLDALDKIQKDLDN